MNAAIAQLLLAKIEAANLPWVDKTAGLTRPIRFVPKSGGTARVWPISCTVNDPLSCDAETLTDLLPNEDYRSILFIEGETFPLREEDRVLGVRFLSRLRIIVWLNCEKLGGGCSCGDLAAQNIMAALKGVRYDASPYKDIRHKVVGGGPDRGSSIFARYTFDEARSQYLNYPFDFFALDVETEFRVFPGCEDQLGPDNVACWTPPTNPRRKYPSEFTCEELQDAETGLTAEQLGPECLDCGTGTCDPITINVNAVPLTNSPDCGDTVNIQVLQGGSPVGTLDPDTGIVTVDECDPGCSAVENVAIEIDIGSPRGVLTVVFQQDVCGGEAIIACADGAINARLVAGAAEADVNGWYKIDTTSTPPEPSTGTAWDRYDTNPATHLLYRASGDGKWKFYEVIAAHVDYESVDTDKTDPADVVTWVGVNGANPAPAVTAPTVSDIGRVCDPCPAADDATVTVNGAAFSTVAAGAGLDVPVVGQNDGLPKGTVAAGPQVEIAPVTVYATDGVTVVDVVEAETSTKLAQSAIKYTDAANALQRTELSNTEVGPSGLEPATVVPRRQILNSAGNPANATYADLDDLISNTLPTAGDATVKTTDGVTTVQAIPSNANGNLPQSVIDYIDQDGGSQTTSAANTEYSGGNLRRAGSFDIQTLKSGIVYQGGRGLWSGQTTEYRTGDEKDAYDAGFFDFTRPAYPDHYAELGANFTTLAANNIHGNTNRFTARDGTAPATSGNRIIQDHLTGYEWYVLGTLSAATWNSQIDAGVALNATLGETGWYLPPIKLLQTIYNQESGTGGLNYGGFLLGATTELWSSTTRASLPTQALFLSVTVDRPATQLKTVAEEALFCRRFAA